MFLYRVKQFYSALTAKIGENEKAFLNTYLNYNELQLFYRLAVYEQKHSINVAVYAKKLQETRNIKSDIIVKAALLHDIGKIEKRLNVIEKSILVLLNKFTKGRIRYISNSKCIDTYYNHPEKGYSILKKYNVDERVLYLVRNHHNKNIKDNKELNILIESDNNN